MDVFLQARQNPKMTTKSEQKNASSDCKSHATSAILKIRRVSFFSIRSFFLASFHFVSFRFVRRPTGLIHPNTRSPAPAACTGKNMTHAKQFGGRTVSVKFCEAVLLEPVSGMLDEQYPIWCQERVTRSVVKYFSKADRLNLAWAHRIEGALKI